MAGRWEPPSVDPYRRAEDELGSAPLQSHCLIHSPGGYVWQFFQQAIVVVGAGVHSQDRADRHVVCRLRVFSDEWHHDMIEPAITVFFVDRDVIDVVRNLSTTLRHRRFLFTDSFLLLWKWRVG